ncbi:unnamed protein product [Rhizophagus irregularis]|uniref:Uncharacterized protein n=1 Tax=Rhizophagus irregularis TaxID=588596 RepID=A0A916EIA2_9GLOM|nr:unnamed protein product [Rhizophagus irregularis]
MAKLYDRWGYVNHPFKGYQGRRRIFNPDDFNILSTLVKDKKDWYLDELASKMERLTGKLVSIPTLWRALNHLGITRKKEVNKDERSLSRAYGYCLKNMRVEKHVVFEVAIKNDFKHLFLRKFYRR